MVEPQLERRRLGQPQLVQPQLVRIVVVVARPRLWAVWVLTAGLAAAALVGTLQHLRDGADTNLPGFVPWVALAVGFALAETCVVHITVGRQAQSFAFSEVPLVAALVFFPSPDVIAARLAGTLLSLLVFRRQSPIKAMFNLAQYWLGATVAITIWDLALPLSTSVAAVSATLGAAVLSAVTVNAAVALAGERPAYGVLLRTTATGLVITVANTAFALVAVDVVRVDSRQLWAVGVVAGFIAWAQWSHVRLQRRHGALQRLNEFTRQVGSDLRCAAITDDIIAGAGAAIDDVMVSLELADDLDAGRAPARAVEPVPDRRRIRRTPRCDRLEAPLVAQGGVIGRLAIASSAPTRALGRDDASLLTALAQHAAVALTNGRLTDRLRAQLAENAHRATHDSLTELPNRALFERMVAASLAESAELSVLLLDLDRFKEVNDTLGHAAGDALLKDVGARIRAAVPGARCVARLGGDEFTILLATGDPHEALRAAHAAREALLHPVEVNSVPVSVDASVGVAIAPRDGRDSEELLRHADVAMYTAKEGRGSVELYRAEIDHNDTSRLSMLGELRQAIEENRLVLHYQPQIDLTGAARHGVEALVRWAHPERGLVMPDEFIPVAEQTGVIGALTDWVLAAALRQCRTWLDNGLDIGVAVNLSPRVLGDPSLPSRVTALLAQHRVPATRLTLEITESGIMSNVGQAVDMLWQLRRAGVRLSIDDLGVGQSSLAYLRRLPVDEVKIDKSFVLAMADDEQDDAIVCAIVSLAHRLGLAVVAEGVEDERAYDRLVELGCEIAQGYWFSRPVPPAEVPAWFDARSGYAALPPLRVVGAP